MTSHPVFPHRWSKSEPVSDRLYLPDLGPVYADLLNELIDCIANTNFNMIDAAEYDNESIKDSQITNSTASGKALIALLDQVYKLRESGMNDSQGVRQELERLLGVEKDKRRVDNKNWKQKYDAQSLEIAKLRRALNDKQQQHEEALSQLSKSMDHQRKGFEQDIASSQRIMEIAKTASDEIIAQREEEVLVAKEAATVWEKRVGKQQALHAESVSSMIAALKKEQMLRNDLVSELERDQIRERTMFLAKISDLERQLEYHEQKDLVMEDDSDGVESME